MIPQSIQELAKEWLKIVHYVMQEYGTERVFEGLFNLHIARV
jgi:hypothetical protein